jgi:hypothetical protein
MKCRTITLITLALTIIISNTHGQKKHIENVKRNTKDLVKQRDLLYELQKINKGLYQGNLSWIHQPIHTESKEDLRRLIFISYPKIQDGFKIDFQDKEIEPSIDSVLLIFDKTILLTKLIMDRLNSFDHYQDNYNINEIENIFSTDISTNFLIAHGILGKSLEKVNTKVETNLDGLMTVKKRKSHNQYQEAIKSNNEIVNSLRLVENIGWEIFTGTLNWVYRQGDTNAKLRLNLYTESSFIPLMNKFESSVNSKTNPFGLILTDSLGSMLDKLKTSSRYITDSLISSANSQTALNLFLAEDKIDSDMNYTYREFRDLVNAYLSTSNRNLNYQLLSKDGDKIEDIRTMLNLNYTIQSTVDNILLKNEESRAYLEFDREELINKLVPVYDEKFTHEEIKEIISFQKSKVGKKLNDYSLTLIFESSVIVKNYLRELENRSKIIRGD